MKTRQTEFFIEEIPGDTFPDLEAAQRAGLHSLAGDIASSIRFLLQSGDLVIYQGRIIPKPKG